VTAPAIRILVALLCCGTLNAATTILAATEVGPVTPLGDQYGEALVSVQFECQMAQLVNILAGLETQPELISTRDFQITASNPKEKTVRVRLTVAGVVPKNLVPDRNKKGVTGF